jgi:hypothetical protein
VRAQSSNGVRAVALTLYYLGILIGVAAVGAGHHGAASHFVYQQF